MAHWLCRLALELLVGGDEKIGKDWRATDQYSTGAYSARNFLQSRIGLE